MCLDSQGLELSAEERRACKEALRRLLGNAYQPVVIQELLLLQNGPKQVGQQDGSSSGEGAALRLVPG